MSDYTNKLVAANRERLIYECLRLRGEEAKLRQILKDLIDFDMCMYLPERDALDAELGPMQLERHEKAWAKAIQEIGVRDEQRFMNDRWGCGGSIIRRIEGRYQPVSAFGHILYSDTVNTDKTGYATFEGAAEALDELEHK